METSYFSKQMQVIPSSQRVLRKEEKNVMDMFDSYKMLGKEKKMLKKIKVYLVTIFENSSEKQFLKAILENCSLIFYRTKVYLET